MSARKRKSEKCAEVKSKLAEKYTHLAMIVKSRPRRESYLRKADSYRRQAADLMRAQA